MTNISDGISIGIGMDTTQFRRDVNYANRLINQSKSAFRDFSKVFETLNNEYEKGAISEKEYVAASNKARLASEKKAEQIRKEAEAVRVLEQANTAAAAAATKLTQNTLGLSSYGGAKPNAGAATSDSLSSFLGAPRFAAQLAAETEKAAAATKAASMEAQKSLAGWANGLKVLAESDAGKESAKRLAKISEELRRAKEGAEAFAAGLRKVKQAQDAVAAEQAAPLRKYNDALLAGARFLRQFETRQQITNRQLAEAARHYSNAAITGREYAMVVQTIRSQNSSLVQGFNQLRGAMLTLVGPLVILVKAWDALKTSIKLSAEIDAATAKFRVFTGTISEAQRTLAEVRRLAETTPISFVAGQRAVTTMLQFGVESRKVIDALKQITEITAGDNQRMEALALAYSQTQAAGRLMGQELLQMVNAGFNPLKVISEQTGESLVSLKKKMEAGGVSAKAVAQAFKDATDEAGRFNGLLEEIDTTTFGLLNRTGSQIEQLGVAIGKTIEPEVKQVLWLILDWSKALTGALNTPLKPSGLVDQLETDLAQAKQSLERSKSTFLSNPMMRTGLLHSVQTILETRIASLQEELRIVKNIEDVRARIAANEFVTAQERNLLADFDTVKRNEIRTSEKDFEILQAQLERDLKKVTNRGDELKLRVEFVEASGEGRFDDAELRLVKSYRKELELIADEQADIARVEGAFAKTIDNLFSRDVLAKYGEDAEKVRLLREQSADVERDAVDELIRQKATFEEILAVVNDSARARVKEFEIEEKRVALLEKQVAKDKKILEDQEKREQQFKNELRGLESKAQFLAEFVALGEKEARIRQLMRDESFTQPEATLIQAAEEKIKQLEKLQKSTRSSGQASGPRATQAGSAEAFSLQAKQQARMISEQIRLADRAFVAQKRIANATEAAAGILDAVKDNLGAVPAP